MRKRVLPAVLAAGILAVGVLVASASAAPGQSQTFHFHSLVDQLGSPPGQTTNSGSNCPTVVLTDFVDINATGNGVVHQTINGNGAWFTSTFTGNATISFWSQGTVDQNGNVTSVGGTEDLQVTGHLTNWDGFSGNRQNAVAHGTIDFHGTVVGTGAPISFHDNDHFAWLPGADQNGPPSFAVNDVHC